MDNNDNEIATSSGSALEKYKKWYLRQPKFVRLVVFPSPIAFSVIIIRVQGLSDGWLCLSGVLLLIHLYNQYLDALASETADNKLEKAIRQRDDWSSLVEGLMNLNNVLKELVEEKSLLFLKTVETYNAESKEAAYTEIRSNGSFENCLDRIVAMIYKVFEHHADTKGQQQFRVTYLTPDESGKRLVARAWYNADQSPPKSIDNGEGELFTAGGRTLAGHLWGRDGSDSLLIDDIKEYFEKNGDNMPFLYTHPGQKSYLKSILCYKVSDKKAHEVLGFFCIDSNVPGTLTKHQQYYEIVLDAFAKRVLFETRVAYMKNVLRRE